MSDVVIPLKEKPFQNDPASNLEAYLYTCMYMYMCILILI